MLTQNLLKHSNLIDYDDCYIVKDKDDLHDSDFIFLEMPIGDSDV